MNGTDVIAVRVKYLKTHIRGYIEALGEAYRVLEIGGRLVATETKAARSMPPSAIGLFYDEQFDILRRLGIMPHGRDFIESVKRTGFNILELFDDPQRPRPYFLIDAIKK